MDTVINSYDSTDGGNILNNLVTIRFSRKALLQGLITKLVFNTT